MSTKRSRQYFSTTKNYSQSNFIQRINLLLDYVTILTLCSIKTNTVLSYPNTFLPSERGLAIIQKNIQMYTDASVQHPFHRTILKTRVSSCKCWLISGINPGPQAFLYLHKDCSVLVTNTYIYHTESNTPAKAWIILFILYFISIFFFFGSQLGYGSCGNLLCNSLHCRVLVNLSSCTAEYLAVYSCR